jgi:hypothetical protein
MPVEILDIADQEIKEKDLQDEVRASHAKRGRVKKCRVCGMSTYQKEGLCVLCKTGIREAGEALMTE